MAENNNTTESNVTVEETNATAEVASAEGNTTVKEEQAVEKTEAPKEEVKVEAPKEEKAAPAKGGKKHIIVDPITRIEGHLRIEAIIDENNTIVDAYSSSTMFRGMETIMKGRDPRDCGLMAMRICGVCTGTHYQRSIEAVEDAFNNYHS